MVRKKEFGKIIIQMDKSSYVAIIIAVKFLTQQLNIILQEK